MRAVSTTWQVVEPGYHHLDTTTWPALPPSGGACPTQQES